MSESTSREASQRQVTGDFIDAAVGDPPAARRMLEAHPELRSARWLHGESLLHFLAVEGYGEAVELLGELGFEVDAVNRFGDTALIDCVTLRNEAMVKRLLALGANPDARSDTRGSALVAAVASGHLGLVGQLLRAGAHTDASADLEEALLTVSDAGVVRELRGLLFGPRGAAGAERNFC